MKTKQLTLFFVALFMMSCTDDLIQEDIQPDTALMDMRSSTGTGGGSSCDQDYNFPTIGLGVLGYKSVVVHYDTTLTEAEVICARYDFFMTYEGLKMGVLQHSDIHTDNWQIPDRPIFPKSYPNRLKISGKVEVETAICVDPRTESEDCED